MTFDIILLCPVFGNIYNNNDRFGILISSSAKIVLSRLGIMFGSLQSASCLALNHLIILGKYFLYVNALNNR